MAEQKQEKKVEQKNSILENFNMTKLIVILGAVILILIIIRVFILPDGSSQSFQNLPPIDQARTQVDNQFEDSDFDGRFVLNISDVSQEEFVEIVEQLKTEKNLGSYEIQPSGELLRQWQFDALNPGVTEDSKTPPIEGGPESLE